MALVFCDHQDEWVYVSLWHRERWRAAAGWASFCIRAKCRKSFIRMLFFFLHQVAFAGKSELLFCLLPVCHSAVFWVLPLFSWSSLKFYNWWKIQPGFTSITGSSGSLCKCTFFNVTPFFNSIDLRTHNWFNANIFPLESLCVGRVQKPAKSVRIFSFFLAFNPNCDNRQVFTGRSADSQSNIQTPTWKLLFPLALEMS